MIKSLDISMYEDGYDVAQVDCLHNPVAAATGYFSRINYFYYCMLHGLLCIMEGYDEHTFYNRCNKVLEIIGLKLNIIDITSNMEENIELIKKSIDNDKPIIVITKYNALFYNAYYRNTEFKSNHGIIVNAINTENCTVGIKEMTLLRDTGLLRENTDVHYSLQITYDILKNIIVDSNEQFILEGSQFQNKIYYIENNSCKNVLLKVLKVAVLWSEQGKDELLNYIENDSLKYDFLHEYKYLRMRFYGSLVAFFSALRKILVLNSMSIDRLETIEKNCLSNRNTVISTLYMNAKRGENILDNVKDEFCVMVKKDIYNLVCYLKNNIDNYTYDEYKTEFIDISRIYNNRAFEKDIRNKSDADITGEGTHFLEENIRREIEWKKGDFSFFLYNTLYNDNISCDGQIIKINKKQEIYKIDFLMCSEYGSYVEKCKIKYESGLEYEIELMVSDFYQPAIYDEFLFWSGIALNRKNGITSKHSFPARLFAKSYSIPHGKIIEIQLPKKKNVHIFAISLKVNNK